MNLQKLFEAQKKLDEHIIKEKGLQGQDLLNKKILALQVELGELANEYRGFKFWSKNQEPRTYALKLGKTPKENRYINPLLEEYVDCLHFILSIGNDLEIKNKENSHQTLFGIQEIRGNTTDLLNDLFTNISDLRVNVFLNNKKGVNAEYHSVFYRFYMLRKQLGFKSKQIEQAYFEKNAENHKRQESGY